MTAALSSAHRRGRPPRARLSVGGGFGGVSSCIVNNETRFATIVYSGNGRLSARYSSEFSILWICAKIVAGLPFNIHKNETEAIMLSLQTEFAGQVPSQTEFRTESAE